MDPHPSTDGRELHRALGALETRLSKAIRDYGNDCAKRGYGDTQHRQRILAAAKAIVEEATLPQERWLDQSTNFSEIVAVRLFMYWGVFDLIPLDGSISYEDLARKLDAEVLLVNRIAWVLVATGILDQIGEDRVTHTARSKIYLKDDPFGKLFIIMIDNGLVPFASLMKYFDSYGRNEPRAMRHNPWCFAAGEPEKTAWEIMGRDPERVRQFMEGMKVLERFIPVTGEYDFTWVVERAKQCPEDRILFVDIGGSRGHATAAICTENPGIPRRRCILQDLEEVLDEIRATGLEDLREIQLMPVDFHQEQPVKGALIYYIRHCLHDYSDDMSVNILKNIGDAMARDSKLLIVENIMTNPPNPQSAWLDLLMMNVGGKERTRALWDSVITRAGLKISGIFSGQAGPHGTIECVKV
ncbi:O-methyltransferase [Penicillium canescens]|uniref:O-methyltransferase n=1 Tax=Penicillium canescens TaxID=5083 RepID=A0AAD6INH4_PENCN|nr:O-methyltransferase [Penicillium canescens]KAJ6057615.1 O-methyltransferase [Penicillium canescens]KAJ6058930.1 O-methyltransferase [Penicillium canescens]